jgi:hypothetical protein
MQKQKEWGMTQVVEYLPSKCEALCLIPSVGKKTPQNPKFMK